MARRFESSRRRELLSFSHHQAVAYDDPAFADALLDWCLQDHEKRGRRTVDELKAERDERIRKRDQENVTRIFRRTIPDRNTTFRIVTEDLPEGGRRTTTTLFPSPPRPMVRLDDSGTFEPVPEQLAALQIEPTAAPPEVAESSMTPSRFSQAGLANEQRMSLQAFLWRAC